MNKPAEDPKVAESEKQIMPKASESFTDDPPTESHDVTVDPMGVDPSSIEPPNPIKPVEETPLQQVAEDVIITGTGYTEPGNPTILARHSAKQEALER